MEAPIIHSDFRFKTVVCGEGIMDCDTMSMTSDAPWDDADLAGSAPWETGVDDTKGRRSGT